MATVVRIHTRRIEDAKTRLVELQGVLVGCYFLAAFFFVVGRSVASRRLCPNCVAIRYAPCHRLNRRQLDSNVCVDLLQIRRLVLVTSRGELPVRFISVLVEFTFPRLCPLPNPAIRRTC